MFTAQRPALASQSWKISLLNYFLAVLVGCSVGSIGHALIDLPQDAQSPVGLSFAFAFMTAAILMFSIPHGLLGLLPVAALGELLARRTSWSPAAITAMAAFASVPAALWLVPGTNVARHITGVIFGLLITLSWALLSFRNDGLAASLQGAERA